MRAQEFLWEDFVMRRLLSMRTLFLALLVFVGPAASRAQVSAGISIRVGPPALPVYVQPPCPVEGYMWTPGYWVYGDGDYYWVPGVWVAPPRVGVLWTPGYWGWNDGVYIFHAGYWGPRIGFYGGVNYGFGYGGVGFVGGEWRGGRFAYNTAVVNVNRTVIHNTYINRTVIVNNRTESRTSFNGGPGGIGARATGEEMTASRETHIQPTAMQVSHQRMAGTNRANFASENHGRPATAAISRVNTREGNQQARIANGAKSGQLTPHETSRLENRQANINREVHNDRAANGGRLTPQERAQVNHQQNNASKQIYGDKHDARTDHAAQQHNAAPKAGHPASEHPHK
jgi:WXXGXW repeat (2 copies)